MPAAKKARDLDAEIAFLTRALKALALRDSAERLAARAREESWPHEEFLIACRQREAAARDAHGGEGRIRAARFPARKSLEEFDFDHARGLKRDLVAHLGTLDFIAEKGTVVFLGPPGTGKTHLATGIAVRACQAGHRVLFATAAQWVDRLVSGRYERASLIVTSNKPFAGARPSATGLRPKYFPCSRGCDQAGDGGEQVVVVFGFADGGGDVAEAELAA